MSEIILQALRNLKKDSEEFKKFKEQALKKDKFLSIKYINNIFNNFETYLKQEIEKASSLEDLVLNIPMTRSCMDVYTPQEYTQMLLSLLPEHLPKSLNVTSFNYEWSANSYRYLKKDCYDRYIIKFKLEVVCPL